MASGKSCECVSVKDPWFEGAPGVQEGGRLARERKRRDEDGSREE